jgi:DNA polymerase III delta prime subunit
MHHAYLLIGNRISAENFLHSFWREKGVELRGSPDFFLWNEPLFGIDEAREVSEASLRKAFTGEKVFFISPERITPEAQNALLKTFEDPTQDTYFFLLTREEELILPTLRSRMRAERLDIIPENEEDAAKKFLSLTLKQRLAFAKKFADSEESLSVFLDKILFSLRKEKGGAEKVKQVYEARRYSDDRAVSARLILEHLSLVL